MNKTILIAICALLGAGVCGYPGFEQQALQERLEREGDTVPGEIMGGESRSGRRGSKSYKMDVEYRAVSGKKVTQTFDVTSAFWEAHSEGDEVKDPIIQVRRSRTDPHVALIPGGSSETPFYPIAGACGVVGLGMLGWAFFKGRSQPAAT